MTEPTDPENPHELYQRIGLEMANTYQAVPSKMFGLECLKIDGKMFAGFSEGGMVFKLTGDAHREALALEGSKLFDPSKQNRAMKAWVQVTAAHAQSWHQFAEKSLEFVRDTVKRK